MAAANHIHFTFVNVAENLQSTALSSGSIQVLNDSATAFLQSVTQNEKFVSIAVTTSGVPSALILSNGFVQAKKITKSTPLTTVMRDIVGSKGGTSSPTDTARSHTLIGSYGVQSSQYSLANFSTSASEEAALRTNQIDWLVTSQPTPDQLQADGDGLVVADRQNAKAWMTNIYGNLAVATQSYASSHPAVMAEIGKSLVQAAAFINSKPSQAVAALQRYVTGLSDTVAKEALSAVIWNNDQQSASGWKAAIAYDIASGSVHAGTSVTEGTEWTNKYVS